MALIGQTETEVGPLSGGCQCGAIRYSVSAGLTEPMICTCRMCQRATGNVLAPFLAVDAERIRWTGSPTTYASSSVAERGFCAACGTPLFYRKPGRASLALMMGSIDGGAPSEPLSYYHPETAPDWLHGLEAVPVKEHTLNGTQLLPRQTTQGK